MLRRGREGGRSKAKGRPGRSRERERRRRRGSDEACKASRADIDRVAAAAADTAVDTAVDVANNDSARRSEYSRRTVEAAAEDEEA